MQPASVAIVLITSALFGAAHLADQGLPGVQNATIAGLVFGSIFAVTRSIWLPVIAHSAFDLTAYGMIYWKLESQIAHLPARWEPQRSSGPEELPDPEPCTSYVGCATCLSSSDGT